MAIAVTLSNLTIAANVPSGTVVGTFNTDGLAFTTNGNPYGYFSLVGRMLVGVWNGQAMPDTYTVQVIAPGGVPYSFAITITPASAPPPPPLPTPVSVTLTPGTVALTVNTAAPNATISAVAVKMSDGSTFIGPFSVTPSGTVGLMSGMNLSLMRALTAADVGSMAFVVTATQNLVSAQATLTLDVAAPPPVLSPDGAVILKGTTASLTTAEGQWTFGVLPGNPGDLQILLNGKPPSNGGAGVLMQVTNGLLYAKNTVGNWYVRPLWTNLGTTAPVEAGTPPPPPVPTAITLTPAAPTMPDNAAAGTVLATATVTMSDGSLFTGSLTTSDTSIFAISGLNVVTSRGLTAADDGQHNTTITATQGGTAVAAHFSM